MKFEVSFHYTVIDTAKASCKDFNNMRMMTASEEFASCYEKKNVVVTSVRTEARDVMAAVSTKLINGTMSQIIIK